MSDEMSGTVKAVSAEREPYRSLILGMVTILAGVVQFVIGVYQLADNIERVAKTLINGQPQA